jgi:uncharacterized protein with von Willebrand factor type A (vWA) domain
MAQRSLWDDDDYYGSYYAPTYVPKRSTGGWKSKYGGGGWSKSSWSSFSYTWDYGSVDNNDDLFVKDAINYLTPTAAEIRKKTHAPKQTSIDTIKELARICYFKMIDEKEYVAEKYADYDALSESEQGEYQQKKALYDSIFEQYIPGFSPLEQAISIYLKLKGQSSREEREERDEDEEIDLTKRLDFDRQLYSDPTINEQLDLNELSKNRKMEIMNHLSLVGQFGSEFKVEKEISEKIVANSDQYSTMIMRDYSQIHMMNLMQKVYPNFRSKFLTKDLTVNVPVDRKEQIQKIIILLDYSGSMHEDEKQIWVNAILIDRFRYVIKGEAEVFFSYFVDDCDDLEFQHIKDREDVIKFWQTFSNEPNGGGTDIGGIVQYVADEVMYSRRLHNLDIDLSEEKPEILIINDGQDSVGSDAFPYKVNAISLMSFSEELKDLCLATEGKQIEVTYDLETFAYSKDVERQQLKA